MTVVQVRDLFTVRKGRKATSVTTVASPGITRLLQINDLRDDGTRLYTRDQNGVAVEERDILIAWDGANAGTVGYGLTGHAGSTLAVLHPISADVYTPYVGRFLQAQFRHLNSSAQGAAVPHVNRRVLDELRVPLPSIDVQRRIAAMLDGADVIRRKRLESLPLLNKLLRSAFLEMFGDPVRNDKAWPRAPLGALLPERHLIVDGPFGSSLKPDSYVESGVRVVRNFNIKDDEFDGSAFKYITEEKFEEVRRSEVKAGDVLISTKGTLGNVCLMPDLEGRSVLSATGTIRVRISDEDVIRREFLVSQMVSASYKQYVKSFEAGTIQKYLTIGAIRKLMVIAPPTDLQEHFCQLKKRAKGMKTGLVDAASDASVLFDSMVRDLFRSDSEKSTRVSDRTVSI